MKFSVSALALLGSLDSVDAFGSIARKKQARGIKPLASELHDGEIDPSVCAEFLQAWGVDDQTSIYQLSDAQMNEILPAYGAAEQHSVDEIEHSPIPFGATRLDAFDPNEFQTYDALSGGSYSGTEMSPRFAFSSSTLLSGSNRGAKATFTALRMTSNTQTEAEVETLLDPNDILGVEEEEEPRLGDGSTLTERMFNKIPTENQAGGAGGASTLNAFKRAEQNWERLKQFEAFDYDKNLLQFTQNDHGPPPQFVSTDGAFGSQKCWQRLRDSAGFKQLDYDVVVCGGTLGIFYAMYLQLQGHRVCVIEAGKLRGREQEWNISMDELDELMRLNVITQDDIDAVITTEFPACRSGFKNTEVTPLEGGYFENGETGYECLTPDVLNLGVTPALLIQRVSDRFRYIGGVIKEETRLSGVCVSELVGSAIDLGEEEEPITARLVLDCMGNASPISAQQRYGQKADGICCVVGSCAGGYEKESNLYGDIIYTNQPIITRKNGGSNQYFWEAFPVGIGRGKEPGTSDVKTTYMFTYMDADENRPSLLQLFEDYWKLLPVYQPSIQNPETDLDIKRILFAFFPTYRDSPLKPEFSRVLAVGDASGIQSPLSFGGFGALTRHLDRIGGAIDEALENDCLHKDDLGLINDYQPNLSAAWMFQKAMSVKMGQNVDPKFVNRLLATNFEVMDNMGPKTMKPFLQDVVRFDGLVGSLAGSFLADPTFMPQIVATVGLPELVKWLGHVGNMGAYSVLDNTAAPVVSSVVENFVKNPREKFKWRRRLESWKYGSGGDYKFPPEE
mmetsp:Transcript_17498/g.48318  ORF Transcript_17498/g.48318 Transcript_17498/m.48318 type:complete len:790 (-) Transcript_17498:119-2488(-)